MKISAQNVHKLVLIAKHVNGNLVEPFTARDLHRILPSWNYTDYFGFLAYNSDYNILIQVSLLIRVDRGSYSLNSYSKPPTEDPIVK
ncbi:hypothetical protein J2782_004472 [Brucella pseudogrignonensis]|uniref:Uncharacterized protein n=1 Tax=Brucella pseudogrignonensis TaxID=419475 RepID=A0ABU1MF86_9HYPH|nr:hypothetical protein [Brucella pseudogrignonensis]